MLLFLHPFPHFRFTVDPLRQVITTGRIGSTGIEMKVPTIVSMEEMEMIEPVLVGGVVALADLQARRNADEGRPRYELQEFLAQQRRAGD